MLKKKERLSRPLFNRSFSVGKRIHTTYAQIIVTEDSSFHGSVVVSKKVYKRSVDRNKIRRQIYALLYRFNKSHPALRTYIIITKPAIAGASINAVFASLIEGLEKS